LGEYYVIANPDKRQCLNSLSLGMLVKLPGVMAGPLPQILVWLLAEGAPITGGWGMAGTWAGDRIVVARDEGPSSEVYQRAYAEFSDITVEAFEDLADHCSYVYLTYNEQGWLDDDGRFISGGPFWSWSPGTGLTRRRSGRAARAAESRR
jgi:hypothetical protein